MALKKSSQSRRDFLKTSAVVAGGLGYWRFQWDWTGYSMPSHRGCSGCPSPIPNR
ncbi:MAG: twin-arginine translocation signal domain-containing protein [SAR202 cluster bacterium]|nr:twin-arginine translocation signal domain-containing protein [SAR202 cluster bacterium]